MQGKLTEQLPSDGNAEDLYQQIQTEKAKLIKEGKIKKSKPLPPIDPDEVPFDIPENWKWVRLGELGDILGGYSFKSNEFTKSGFQVVRITDLDDNSILTDKAVFYKPTGNLERYRVVANSILICLTGSIGKMTLIGSDIGDYYLNQRVGMFRAYNVDLLGYIWRALHSDYAKSYWISKKTSTNGNIKNEVVLKTFIPLPPLAEQKRIVEKLNSLLTEVDNIANSIGE